MEIYSVEMHWNPNSFVITEINILIDQNEMIDGLKISIAVLFNKIKLNWIKKTTSNFQSGNKT